VSLLEVADRDQIAAITAEIFAAMVDGEEGLLVPWSDGTAHVDDPLHAWVDMHAEGGNRLQLTTDAGTADDLARALLGMDPDEKVPLGDLVDAFGEVANVIGGNLKALLPVQGRLTMPEVSRQSPSTTDAVQLDEVPLAWRGRPLIITVWTI
jgi:hypothetical protein